MLTLCKQIANMLMMEIWCKYAYNISIFYQLDGLVNSSCLNFQSGGTPVFLKPYIEF